MSGDAVGSLDYHETCSHKADVFTKALEKGKFDVACRLIGVQSSSHAAEGGVEIVAAAGDIPGDNDGGNSISHEPCLCMDRDCDERCHLYLSYG